MTTPFILQAQNLIPNPSFEYATFCPNSSSQLFYAVPWDKPSYGTPDYVHACATFPEYGVPSNSFGYQDAHSGVAYAGALYRFSSFNGREYLRVPLIEPLEAGELYALSYWVSVADEYCGINQFGAFFSPDALFFPDAGLINVTPQLNVTHSNTNADDWTLISGCFVAEGNEAWLILGNFTPDSGSPFNPGCGGTVAYYFIDDVSLVPANLDEFDLGDPVIACDQYEINPGYPGAEYQWEDGSTGQTYTVTSSGVYAVTATSFCEDAIDSIEVTIIEDIPVEIIPEEITFCEGESYTLSLMPPTHEYTWQDGASGPQYTITEAGVYAVTMSDGCHVSSDQIEIHVIPPPEPFSLGPDVSICPGEVYAIEFEPDLGDFLWQDGSTDPSILISQPGLYSLSITNTCGTETGDINVVLLLPPVIGLGDSLLLCDDASFDIVLDPGLGSFEWQDESNASTYTIQSPGLYTVTVTNFCGVGSDSIVVEYQSSPVVALGPDLSLCPGEDVVLMIDHPGQTIVWQDLSTADTFLVSIPGIYFVQSQNDCGLLADTVIVSFLDTALQLNLPPSLPLCQGDTITLDAAIDSVSFLWSDGSSTSSIFVSTPGTYSLSVSNACISISDTTYVEDGGVVPFVSLGTDVPLCVGDTVDLLPSYSDVDTWLWHDGSMLSSYEVSSPGLVSVLVSNVCGSDTDTLLVDVLPQTPDLHLGPDTSLCPGEMMVLAIDLPGVNIVWSDGSQSAQLTIENPGLYAATIADACGQNTDTISVFALPDIPVLDLGSDPSLCPGALFTLDPGITGVSYLWHDGSTDPVYTTSQPGVISLIISNSCGVAYDSLTLLESTEGPNVDLGPDMTGCVGQSITIDAGISGVAFLWHDGSTGSSFTLTGSDTLILQVSNLCGTDSDTMYAHLSGLAPVSDLGPDTIFCEGASVVVTASVDPATSISWQDGAVGSTYEIHSAGVYTAHLSNACGSLSDSISVAVELPPPPFDLGPDTTLCPGEHVILYAPASSDALTWQDGSSATSFLADQAQLYTLFISNGCGMSADEILVSVDPDVPFISLEPSMMLCPDMPLSLDAAQLFTATYIWSTGQSSPSIVVTTPGYYVVTVESLCSSVEHGVNIISADDCGDVAFYVPNVFTPDGDGMNDVFEVFASPNAIIVASQGDIYDRWGSHIFSTTDIPFVWQGNFNGVRMNPGVFVYRVRIDYIVGGEAKSKLLQGDITLLR